MYVHIIKEKEYFSKIEEFKPLEFMCNLKSDIYADMNNKFFKENISRTSCGWRGKNVINNVRDWKSETGN